MAKNKNILVVGGAGYIGSHMVWMLKEKGYTPIVFDNLSTGCRTFVPKGVNFIKGDLRKVSDIKKAFNACSIDTVMHFAASISVPESVEKPLKYYENNVLGCINLLNVMQAKGVKKFIFSSTAAVYGEPKKIPIQEDDPTIPANPYGWSKLMMERILLDLSKAGDFKFIALRYFNAAGSHPSGKIGQWHPQVTNLIPAIMRSLKGEQKELLIYGTDYPTKDGTCVRDYIHVQDLCRAHLMAVEKLDKERKHNIFNLGSGTGYTVKEIVKAVEKVSGASVPHKFVGRRPGDPGKLIASSARAQKELGWKAQFGLDEIISSAWNWHK